jgi:hypothetical protein
MEEAEERGGLRRGEQPVEGASRRRATRLTDSGRLDRRPRRGARRKRSIGGCFAAISRRVVYLGGLVWKFVRLVARSKGGSSVLDGNQFRCPLVYK